MDSVYTIMRRMFRRGYTMVDLSTDKMFDKHNQEDYNNENRGVLNENNKQVRS